VLYLPISEGRLVCVKDIDYDAFTEDDVGEFEEFYEKTLYRSERCAGSIANALSLIPAAAIKTNYI
jgi:hypothetical protein